MKRVVVTGGAGFIGSHLCEALIQRGDTVTAIDNLSSGSMDNLTRLLEGPSFTFVDADICEPFEIAHRIDAVAHLASPASPNDYLRLPLETLDVGSRGTTHAIELANRKSARFVLTSTSEVYGDPLTHPQPETYWGNVNPIGPRSVYDEAKRFAEALTMAHRRQHGTRTGIVRIFNTYGPRLRPDDGRVVSNFIHQALAGVPITIYGDGSQTRSFCYIEDTVRGLVSMIDSEHVGPLNLGNPAELTVKELATTVKDLCASSSQLEYASLPTDDPTRRCPDISNITKLLGWRPVISLTEGLRRTIEWFKAEDLQFPQAFE